MSLFENRMAGLPEEGLTEGYRQKVLICYLLHTTKKKRTAAQLFEAIRRWQLLSFFELCDELQSLTESGHLTAQEDEGDVYYAITEQGKRTSSVLQTLLPRSLRDAAAESALALLSKEQKAGEGSAVIEKEGESLFCHLEIQDGTTSLLSCRIQVPDEMQGEQINARFLADPTAFYRHLLKALTETETSGKENG